MSGTELDRGRDVAGPETTSESGYAVHEAEAVIHASASAAVNEARTAEPETVTPEPIERVCPVCGEPLRVDLDGRAPGMTWIDAEFDGLTLGVYVCSAATGRDCAERATREHVPVPEVLPEALQHNHADGGIKPLGECPACDDFHVRHTGVKP